MCPGQVSDKCRTTSGEKEVVLSKGAPNPFHSKSVSFQIRFVPVILRRFTPNPLAALAPRQW